MADLIEPFVRRQLTHSSAKGPNIKVLLLIDRPMQSCVNPWGLTLKFTSSDRTWLPNGKNTF